MIKVLLGYMPALRALLTARRHRAATEGSFAMEGMIAMENSLARQVTLSMEGMIAMERSLARQGTLSMEWSHAMKGSLTIEGSLAMEGTLAVEGAIAVERSLAMERTPLEGTEGNSSKEISTAVKGAIAMEGCIVIEDLRSPGDAAVEDNWMAMWLGSVACARDGPILNDWTCDVEFHWPRVYVLIALHGQQDRTALHGKRRALSKYVHLDRQNVELEASCMAWGQVDTRYGGENEQEGSCSPCLPETRSTDRCTRSERQMGEEFAEAY